MTRKKTLATIKINKYEKGYVYEIEYPNGTIVCSGNPNFNRLMKEFRSDIKDIK